MTPIVNRECNLSGTSELPDRGSPLGEARPTSEKAFSWSAVVLLAILVLLTRIAFLFVNSVDWDETGLMAESWAMTKGQVLYKDISQTHPPLKFFVVLPFFYLLRPEWVPLALKTLNLCLVLVGALLIGRLAFEWLACRTLSLLAGLFFIFYCSWPWAQSAHSEFYAIYPILLSAWMLYFVRKSMIPVCFVVGGLWGVAFFFKQVAIFDAIGLSLGYLCISRASRRSLVPTAGLMALGFSSVTAAVSIYFLYHGSLPDAWDSIFGSAFLYARGGKDWSFLTNLGTRTISTFSLSLLPAAYGAIRLANDDERRTNSQGANFMPFFSVLLIWFFSDVVGLCTIGRFYDHYLLQLVPQASLLPLAALARVQMRWRTAIVGATVLGLLALAVGLFATEMRVVVEQNRMRRSVPRSTAVADYIKKHTHADDRIFVYKTRDIDIFFLSQRLSNNGVYIFPDMISGHTHDPAQEERKQREFLSNLPAVIVVGPAWAGNENERLSLTFFEDVLRKYYKLDTTFEGLQIYSHVSH